MRIDIEDVRKRSEWFQDSLSGEGSIGGYGMAAAAIKSAEDVPALLDEVEALREMLKAVKPRDDYLITRAEKAEAERDRLRAAVDAVRALVQEPNWVRNYDASGTLVSEVPIVHPDRIHAALDAHLGEG